MVMEALVAFFCMGFYMFPGLGFCGCHFSSALLLVFVCMFVEVSNSLE